MINYYLKTIFRFDFLIRIENRAERVSKAISQRSRERSFD